MSKRDLPKLKTSTHLHFFSFLQFTQIAIDSAKIEIVIWAESQDTRPNLK